MQKEFLPRNIRLWIYNVTLALLPILTTLGVLTNETAPLIIGLISAVLGLSTARAYLTPEESDGSVA